MNKFYIFQCMGKIFCVEFQRLPLKFHTKYLTIHWKMIILYNVENLRALRFKSSKKRFWNTPQHRTVQEYVHTLYFFVGQFYPLVWGLTLLMLKMEYSGSFGQYHAYWCPGSLSRQGISRNGIDNIWEATCRVVPFVVHDLNQLRTMPAHIMTTERKMAELT